MHLRPRYFYSRARSARAHVCPFGHAGERWLKEHASLPLSRIASSVGSGREEMVGGMTVKSASAWSVESSISSRRNWKRFERTAPGSTVQAAVTNASQLDDVNHETTFADLGQSFVGLIVVILILGGFAAVVLGSQGGRSGGRHGSAPTTLPGGLSASLGDAGNDVPAAAAIACRSNYEAVAQVVSYYQTLNGKLPASMTAIQSLFKDPVSSSYFTLSIDPRQPGTVDVATPGHPALAGDANCAHAG